MATVKKLPIIIPESQFKDVKFESQKEFNIWLVAETHAVLNFEDKGHDLLRMYIHKTGEILHCNAHERLYNGSFVKMDCVEVGKPVFISDAVKAIYREMGALIIEQLEFPKKEKK